MRSFLLFTRCLSFLCLWSLGCRCQPICDTDRECYGMQDLFCDDAQCNLICNGTQSCFGLHYACNSTHASSVCNVQCDGYEACRDLKVYSIANTTTVNCLNWPSVCLHADIECDTIDNSTNNTNNAAASCALNCHGIKSCDAATYQCFGDVQHCDLHCDEHEACAGVAYGCEACVTTTTSDGGGATTTKIYEPPIVDIDSAVLSSRAYHGILGVLFLLAACYMLYCIWYNAEFFKASALVDAAFSTLPILLFLALYQMLSCWVMAGKNEYLSSRTVTASVLFWCLVPPLHLLVIVAHVSCWYLYLIYYGRISALDYLYVLSSRISAKYPRCSYFLPMLVLLVCGFLTMVIAYSVSANNPTSGVQFVCVMVILECVGACFGAFKLLSISVTFMQTEFVATAHEESTMKYTCCAAFALVIVYILYFVCALVIYDEDSVHFQSYLADTLRVFQLLCELVVIVVCAHLFEYIPPNPELHVMHRSQFRLYRESQKPQTQTQHVQSRSEHGRELIQSALQQQNTDAYTAHKSEHNDGGNGGSSGAFGVTDAQKVLLPNTKVYVYRSSDSYWALATVQEFADRVHVCNVTLDDDEQKHTDDDGARVQIDLSQPSQAQHIKLAIFGIDPSWLSSHEDTKYSLKQIPVVLTALRDLLFRHNGHCQVGLFKQKPRRAQYQAFRLAMEQNRMDMVDSDELYAHNIAQFIKDFYSEIPAECNCLQTLDFASNDFSEQLGSVQDMKALLNNKHGGYKLKPNKASKMIMVWLWYLCADILQSSHKNNMSEVSLSAEIAPCLYSSSSKLSQTQSNIQSFCVLGIKYAVLKHG